MQKEITEEVSHPGCGGIVYYRWKSYISVKHKTSLCLLTMRNNVILFPVMFSVNPPHTSGYFSQLVWSHWLWDAGPILPPTDTFKRCFGPALTLHFMSYNPALKFKINNSSWFQIQPRGYDLFFTWFIAKMLIITVNKLSVLKCHLVCYRSEWLWAGGTNKSRMHPGDLSVQLVMRRTEDNNFTLK